VAGAGAQVGLAQDVAEDAAQGFVRRLGHQLPPARVAVAAQRAQLGRGHPQLRRGGVVAGVAVDRAVALQQHEHQQFQVALAERAEALQLRLAQEFGGERRRVFEFELLHGIGLLRCRSIAGAGRRGWDALATSVPLRAGRRKDGTAAYAGVAASARPVASCAVRQPATIRTTHTIYMEGPCSTPD
jgi:hypothetical protein